MELIEFNAMRGDEFQIVCEEFQQMWQNVAPKEYDLLVVGMEVARQTDARKITWLLNKL